MQVQRELGKSHSLLGPALFIRVLGTKPNSCWPGVSPSLEGEAEKVTHTVAGCAHCLELM